MPIKRSQIEKALKKKGFAPDETRHHRYFHHEVDGKRTGAYTYVSRGSGYKDYSDELIGRMKTTLKLDRTNDVVKLLDCRMTSDGFNSILRDKGFLEN